MRKIVILLVLLVAAVLITPGVIGFSAETRYKALIGGMAKNGLEVVETHYQRGWFESTADTEFRIPLADEGAPMPEGAPSEIRFTLHSDIKHGPLSPEGGLVLAQVQSDLRAGGEPLFPGLGQALFKTDIKLNGNGRLLVDLPAMQSEPQPGKPGVQFDGLTGHLTFDAGITELALDVNMPQLKLSEAGGQSVEFQGVSLNSHSQEGVAGLMLGKGSFSVKHLGFQAPPLGQGITIDGIDITFDSNAQEKNVLFSIVYAFQNLHVNDASWGPAVLEIRIDNLSADALAKMQRQMEEINERNLEPTEQGMAVVGLLMETASELLPNDPRLAIPRFRVETPDGVVEGDFMLQSHGLAWAEIGDVATALGKLEMKASLRMPEPLLRTLLERQARMQMEEALSLRRKMGEEVEPPSEEKMQELAKLTAEQKLDSLLTQGLVVRTDAEVASVAGLSGGLLTINGKTIPLPSNQPPQGNEMSEQSPATEGMPEAPAAEEGSGAEAAPEAASAEGASEETPAAAEMPEAPVAGTGPEAASVAGTPETKAPPAAGASEVSSGDAASEEPSAAETSGTPVAGKVPEAPAAEETPEASPPAKAE